ncbi:MAG: cytochrome c biogenesis protein CcsA [Akkermansia sp.]
MMRFLASRYLSLVLLLLYALLLALATWLEKLHGTQLAQDLVYFSPYFILLQAGIALHVLAILIRGHYWRQKRYGMLLIHGSILVILAGALVTHLMGQEGIIHLREGQQSSSMLLRNAPEGSIEQLPFSITLRDFELKRYPGSGSPSSYESHITLHHEGRERELSIYMNNTLDVAGYRLFQMEYDPDERGSYLLVNQDALGRRITYTGYALLGLGLLMGLFARQGRVGQLFARLSQMSLLAMMILPSFTQALDARELEAVPQEQAAAFGRLAVQDNKGRIIPMNSFASQALRKLHGSEEIGDMNPEQFLLSLWLHPREWQDIPLFSYKHPDVHARYKLPLKHVAVNDLFDASGRYILRDDVQAIYQKEANKRTLLDKEILKLDEKLNIWRQLYSAQLMKIFPNEGDSRQRWFAPGDDLSSFYGAAQSFVSRVFPAYLAELQAGDSKKAQDMLDLIASYQSAIGVSSGYNREKLDAEIRYNSYRIFPRCKLAYFITGGVLFLLSLLRFFSKARWIRWVQVGFVTAALLALAAQSYGIGLRWYIAGHAPWSSSYESMVYIGWVSALIGILVSKRSSFVGSLSLIFAGVILFVSGLQWMDPEISPLVPVLKSAWLMFHVAVIVAAYGFFGIAALIGMSNLLLMILRGKKAHAQLDHGIQELSIINELLLWFGLALMAVGSYLGAIWANESWGRYWGWDPKETWALITIITYIGVTHLSFMKKIYSLWLFNFLSLAAMLVVLMTYFGVNYFLSGMHAYGSTQLSESAFMSIGVGIVALLLIGALARLRSK